MPATSGTFNFQSIQAELIIREAYERLGILGELVVAEQLVSAHRSINFILTEWANRNVNLWVLENSFLPLTSGLPTYTLPIQVKKVIQVNLRTSIRQLNGIPGSYAADGTEGGGIAANAFDNNPATTCTQNVENGYISYNYGINNQEVITFIGIQSNQSTTYTITIDGSNDAINWTTLLNLGALQYVQGLNQWSDMFNITPYRFYRVKENGGATLDIQEIYFNNVVQDTTMSEISRYEYQTYPQKHLVGRPTTYYVDYSINPVIYIWPTPSPQYNCITYSWQQAIQDVGAYTNSIQVPSGFYESLLWGLAYRLALKYAPDKAQLMKGEYEQALSIAINENSENVPMRIAVDYTAGRYR